MPWSASWRLLGQVNIAGLTFAYTLVVMCPHPQDTNRALLRKHFIDQTVLDVDPSRIRTREVTHQLLKGRRVLERIALKDIQEGLGFLF